MGALYTDLLTITDLQLESEQFAEFDLSDTGTLTAAQAIINQVTNLIEGGHIGIDLPVVVTAHTIYTQYEDWTYDAARAKYWYQSTGWPVVEIDTSNARRASRSKRRPQPSCSTNRSRSSVAAQRAVPGPAFHNRTS